MSIRSQDFGFNININLLKRSLSITLFIFLFTILMLGPVIYWTDPSILLSAPSRHSIFRKKHRTGIPLNCSYEQGLHYQTCPNNYPTTFEPEIRASSTCPDYFQWINEDLKPWKQTGITREMLERGKNVSHFRLAIVNNNAYIERFGKSFQTRDNFTIWGILQLLRLYPGKVPDLELMFFCDDRTVVPKRDHQGANATWPPPVFHYCANDKSLDILFPDWTFWGWAETNIKPWEETMGAIKEGNNRTMWVDRVPYAYWKGNSHVAPIREDLMKCNVSNTTDWNARLYNLNWVKEHKKKYEDSRLEDQCTHRYKIYIEGRSWSVSRKYILACDSMTLVVKPNFYDFFSRSMVPMQHYWPIRTTHKCQDIKFAVDWGNSHTDEAQAIGKAGSKFIEENLKMEYIYDYMFHLLREYAKLLKFKPKIPQGAEAVCSEAIACNTKRFWKKHMVQSLVKSPCDKLPCTLLPLHDTSTLQAFSDRKASLERQVATQVTEFWDNMKHKQ